MPTPSSLDNGDVTIGPDYAPAPETLVQPGVPAGVVHAFTMESRDSRLYPGIKRLDNEITRRRDAHGNRIAAAEHEQSVAGPYTRTVWVYVPAHYAPGTPAPFIVAQDGYLYLNRLPRVLDNLIAAGRVPPMVAILVDSGGGDAQGSQRGLEYDTLSGRYSDFIETEVLPRVIVETGVTLTNDPDSRATMGVSSGAACAFTMAWFHPELYRRVLAYSPTMVNQQWPWNPATPGGAFEFHRSLIPKSTKKPIRIWMEVGDRDLMNPNTIRDGMHDWVGVNEEMAKVLAAKGYHYQFVFAQNAGHVDRATKMQTLPEALEYVWQGYHAGK